MGAISFSEPWMVDKILRLLKTQTIRLLCKCKHHPDGIHYPVGSTQKLMFKMRSTPKDSWFDLKSGKIVGTFSNEVDLLEQLGVTHVFPKHFATRTITEVIESNLFFRGGQIWDDVIKLSGAFHVSKWWYKKEGFKTEREMAYWFHNAYDLNQPKRFAVYRWNEV